MSEEKALKNAQATYAAMCKALDEKGWKYERHDDDLLIKSGVRGDDLPIEFLMLVRAKQQVVSFISPLPFKMSEEKRIDGAVAVAVANYGLVDGSFDYDISDGEIRYRLTSSFRESILGADVFEYMIVCASQTVDRYNDRFFMLSKGMLSLEQFIAAEKSE